MDALQEEYQSHRRKIYTTPSVVPPPHRSKSPGNRPEATDRVVLPIVDGTEPKFLINKGPAYLSAAEFETQIERHRAVLKEKEVELARIKHELLLSKQLERRQQKELEAFEVRLEEAPKIIKSLQDEILRLKIKIKQYFAQKAEDARRIRILDDERTKLKDENNKLEKLNQEKNLLERLLLTKKVEDLSKKILESEKKSDEASKKYATTERNLSNDNRQLRGKIHAMEKEILLLRDRTVTLDDVIRDKDKSIASLSIYRYNAIHRKVEATCKRCINREKAESELKRKTAILEKLPNLIAPTMTLLSSTAVMVTVNIPQKKPKSGSPVEYSRLTLVYSDDPSMQSNVHKVLVDLETNESAPVTRKATIIRPLGLDDPKTESVPRESNSPNAFNREDEPPTPVEAAIEEKLIFKKIKVTNLASGKFYFFQLTAGFYDVEGTPSQTESIFVDGLPQCPIKPDFKIHDGPSPTITISTLPAYCSGSAIQAYRLYHSTTGPVMNEAFLADEIKTNDLAEKSEIKFTFKEPELRVKHWFTITAVNAMGEGPASDPTEPALLDYAPLQPSKPNIKKLSSSSVQVSFTIPSNGGSEPDSITMYLYHDQLEKQEQELCREIKISSMPDMEYTIKDLEPDTTYQVRVKASNCIGESELSEWSEKVNLDALVPVSPPPTFTVISPTSVELQLPSIASITRPKLTGFRILWSTQRDLLGDKTSTLETPILNKYIVDGLDSGESYYFAICFKGQKEEGIYSPVVYIPLSSAFQLPDSPPPTPPPVELSSLDKIPNSLKHSSSLSLSQKYKNMHDGMPSQFDPVTGELVSTDAISIGSQSLDRKKSLSLDKLKNGSRRNSDTSHLNRKSLDSLNNSAEKFSKTKSQSLESILKKDTGRHSNRSSQDSTSAKRLSQDGLNLPKSSHSVISSVASPSLSNSQRITTTRTNGPIGSLNKKTGKPKLL